MKMIRQISKYEELYLSLLITKLKIKDYMIIGKYKGKTIVVYKKDLVKGFWDPKEL